MCKCFNRRGAMKKRHLTEEDACKEAQSMESKYREKFDTYLCHWCGFWHVGRA